MLEKKRRKGEGKGAGIWVWEEYGGLKCPQKRWMVTGTAYCFTDGQSGHSFLSQVPKFCFLNLSNVLCYDSDISIP